MSTRSCIGFVGRDDSGTVASVRGVYCHWDGYLEWNGRILAEHYDTAEKVNALLDLGYISVLRNEIGEKHDFENFDRDAPQRVNGWTTAYRRDRGETRNNSAKVFSGADAIKQFRAHFEPMWAEYCYLFDKGKWYWTEPGKSRWLVLSNSLKSLEV